MSVKLNVSCIVASGLLFCSAALLHAEDALEKESAGEKKAEEETVKEFTAPAGWKKGLKKGWEKNTPPGWDKFDEKTKRGWEKELRYQKKQIRNRAERNDWNAKDCDAVVDAYEFAVRSGVTASHARLIMDGCIVHGIKGDSITGVGYALADGVGKEDNYKTLATDIVAKLNQDYAGEKLINEIYFLIDARQKERGKAPPAGRPVELKEKDVKEAESTGEKAKKLTTEKKEERKPKKSKKK